MAFNNVPQYLILLEPEYECVVPDMNETLTIGQTLILNQTNSSLENDFNPLSLFVELKRQCHISNDTTVPCRNGYKYKTDFIYPTIISRYNWVCDDASPKFLAHSLYWVGSILGVLIIGQVSDE